MKHTGCSRRVSEMGPGIRVSAIGCPFGVVQTVGSRPAEQGSFQLVHIEARILRGDYRVLERARGRLDRRQAQG